MDALYAVVAAEQLDKAEANRIAGESRGRGLVPIKAEQAGRKGPWVLEDASDDAISWNLTPDGAEQLGRTFAWLFARIPGELTFEVLWGEDPIEKLVSRDELLRIVATGHLGGRTRYRVWAA